VNQENSSRAAISARVLLWAGLLIHLLAIPPLYFHASEGAALVFGRYSSRYLLALGLHAILTVVSLLSVCFAPRLLGWLAKLPISLKYTISGFGVFGTLILWLLPVEAQIPAYMSAIAVWTVALLTTFDNDVSLKSARRWALLIGVAVALTLAAMVITALSKNVYQPDEAHYTDYALSYWSQGELISTIWLSPSYTIEPGYGWAIAGYGWLVQQTGYTVVLGRWLNIIGYGIGFVGIYAVGARLYSRRVGGLAAVTMALSMAFIPTWLFSPNHFIVPVAVWLLFALVVAREGTGFRHLLLHGIIGLAATSSLNVHMAGVILAVAYSLFYALDALWCLWKARQWRVLWPLVAFGTGALLGTTLYYFTNIHVVGGIFAYLEPLLDRVDGQTGSRPALFFYTRWPSLFEQCLILAGFGYLGWRHTAKDRLLLAIFALTLFAAVILDSEGYIWHYGSYVFLPVGVLLAEGFSGISAALTRRNTWVAASIIVLMVGQELGTFVDWPVVSAFVRTRKLPIYLYNELKGVLPPYVHPDDVIYSTHQLIWVFPHEAEPELVSYAAEINGIQRFAVDTPQAVWEVVQPTVIIFVENHMIYNEGMLAYLEDHPFAVCHTLTVQDHQITILRPDCADSPIPSG
jgi:hypothetical protein